ncbi:MAG: NAD-dependent protein deacetylase [Pseudomonadales bacterium]
MSRKPFSAKPPLTVLTGAGISADSGIPTYRDEAGQWLGSTPIQHQDFMISESTRKRYWSRSMHGWPTVANAEPNTAHLALVSLQQRSQISLLVTQNVDDLHRRAGHKDVIDLHGRITKVKCLTCNALISRAQVQTFLEAENGATADTVNNPRPDGDFELPDSETHDFKVPACEHCGGVLMPDVVFFGGIVPQTRVDTVREDLQNSSGLLVMGSSLAVYSGYRFCKYAQAMGKPIYLVNPGVTRADQMATEKFDMDCSSFLNGWLNALDE